MIEQGEPANMAKKPEVKSKPVAARTKSAAPAKPEAAPSTAPQQLDPAIMEKIAAIRSKVNETFGKVALAMMATPRYRHLSIGDLSHLVLDPLIRDRVALAQPAKQSAEDGGLAGIAIWASVSETVDATIREQIKSGVFPVRQNQLASRCHRPFAALGHLRACQFQTGDQGRRFAHTSHGGKAR
jgi:hemolysin-activating ACP:hemolysin acyltransferase